MIVKNAKQGIVKSTNLLLVNNATYVFPLDNNSDYIVVANTGGNDLYVNIGSAYASEAAIILKNGSTLKMPTPQQLALTVLTGSLGVQLNVIEFKDYTLELRLQA